MSSFASGARNIFPTDSNIFGGAGSPRELISHRKCGENCEGQIIRTLLAVAPVADNTPGNHREINEIIFFNPKTMFLPERLLNEKAGNN